MFASVVLFTQCAREPRPVVVVETEPTVAALITTFLDGGGTYRDIPFSEVVEASSGRRIIPLDPNDEVDALILEEISFALDDVLAVFNQADSPSRQRKKISDVAERFEGLIKNKMEAAPGFSCDYPRTKEGNLQRSGYPDLRIVHEDSGRVSYLAPKLIRVGSLESSLRTFYFIPKGESGKVRDDAHHFLVGIEYDGNQGDWSFERWKLVDLANFRVKLKAEFQASNKDIYTSELIVRQAEKKEQ